MTSPIKPSDRVPSDALKIGEGQDATGPKPATSFREVASQPEKALSSSHIDPALSGIVDELRAGKIDANMAIERIVESVLGATGQKGPRSAELETFLREMLAEDPSLLELQKDLAKAR